MTRYVALLRGINVGGNNLIKMPALRECIEQLGMRDVSTYIASGNVLFDSPKKQPEAKLAAALEAGLAKRFDYEARLTLRSREQLQAIVNDAPKGFGEEPEQYRYDCIFLFAPMTASEALPRVPQQEGVDRLWAGDGVLYASRRVAKASSSRLGKLVGTTVYRSMTIRNWNTTTKLAALLGA